MEHTEKLSSGERKEGMTRREFVKKTSRAMREVSLAQFSPEKEEEAEKDPHGDKIMQGIIQTATNISENPNEYRQECKNPYTGKKCRASQLLEPFEHEDFVLTAFKLRDKDQPERHFNPNIPSVKIFKIGNNIDITFYSWDNGEEIASARITKDHEFAGMLIELIRQIGLNIRQ